MGNLSTCISESAACCQRCSHGGCDEERLARVKEEEPLFLDSLDALDFNDADMACRPNAFSAVSVRSAAPVLFLNTCDGGENDFCRGEDNESNEGEDEKQVALNHPLNIADARLVADAPMAAPMQTD